MINTHRLNWLPYVLIVTSLHILGFGFLYLANTNHLLLGMGLLAYTLGLRHAFDADHIAAIDNTVRKLIQQQRNPVGVGFYFSIGHSTVVFFMAVFLGISIKWAKDALPHFQEIGGIIGTLVSGTFLILIGILNLMILISLITLFLKFRKDKINDEKLNDLLDTRGFVSRMVGPYFKFISHSWHVLPLGFLFGLGFDTASEISLLALSSGASQQAISFVGILSLPILFAAGMSLLDTLDGILMTSAYNWAFFNPIRKIYYNITITAISVIAALLIGTVELLQILVDKLQLKGSFWEFIENIQFDNIGYILVILFIISWLISTLIWKFGKVEQRWSS
ncbi:HoxN/HupN/NixA family nickel/cobalt transporter [Staphylococcus haemolyticus]|uniref:HoxN/HupN/NixA family nickel/cobalt transporter n=1 Tax=Staphylococcus TaxID=1279 RepID=UPI000D1E899F|nr:MULTISPECIES: HoxN/HupN/NixA family nickel/cobalt transporter [Staphylococcus]PTK73935.1 nickel transporter NixA [Staphylococcus haemolyticus]PTK83948.1 nickel transporter NixA [Staphylococcus haemolyticus]PTK96343.1 nickel transporter NixA [Staphylococcus haemolyticus]RIO63055.1 HoxN/HupN/NixA family nickel/cobalt transporter [Staphylococcus haemolyticus]RIO67692.1 HoxN/HupN/NixA family nickel/cobalt transporter [Staphylococcus haemolyticus]